MNIVIVGHVDHGKSTIIGRLLADTDSLPKGKLEQVKEKCRRSSKPFEYAFLLDALKDEQEQGITIDAARCFFNTKKRDYIIIDAPGHIEFLKNMVTGASRAEVALLVIDANEGIKENSKRHGYLLSMLGIKKIAVLVNKMDLVDYDEEIYEKIVEGYTEFLEQIDIKPEAFVPVSGFEGVNIAEKSKETPWYGGKSVLDLLDSFETMRPELDQPFRMPIQGVYKFTKKGDKRRIVAGTIETGKFKVGDEVVFYPSGKKSRVKTIESLNKSDIKEAHSGYATGFTLDEQIYVKRGEVAALASEQRLDYSTRIRGNIFWLGTKPITIGSEYMLKIGTAKSIAKVEKIVRVIDASNLKNEQKGHVDRHDVAEIIFKTAKPIAFDLADKLSATSRFVIVDDYEISGGGIVVESLDSEENKTGEGVYENSYIWEKSLISKTKRAKKYGQTPTLVLLAGNEDSNIYEIGKQLEKQLIEEGKNAFFIGIGKIKNGAVVSEFNPYGNEHMKRFADTSNLLIEAGNIVIAVASGLGEQEIDIIGTRIDENDILKVWLGRDNEENISDDIDIKGDVTVDGGVSEIKKHLEKEGIIFKAG
ncbi:sulfate adenylyltransferase subunit 1 [Peptoclostridium litorale]|nr:GTP-binding protein [Peptoclostridium litorale]